MNLKYVLLASVLLTPACATNPLTGKQEIDVFAPLMSSRDQQVQLGIQAAPQFEAQGGGRLQNQQVQAYVNSVGMKIVHSLPASATQGYQFSYTVLNQDIVNAFALPGGPIFITRGILLKMNSEAQLAFVLGHETGHVVAQHVARQTAHSDVINDGLKGIAAILGDKATQSEQLALKVGGYGSQLYLLKFGRDEESQADALGLDFVTALNYDPHASIEIMKILDSLGNNGNEWLATHPAPKNRLADLQHIIDTKYPGKSGTGFEGTAEYQQNVLSQLR